MRFDIRPHIGVGPIEFGHSIDQVRQKLGQEDEKFLRVSGGFPEYVYEDYDLFINTREENAVNACEFFRGSAGLWIWNTDLKQLQFSELRKLILSHDPDAIEEETGSIKSYKYGIAIYSPLCNEEPHLSAEAIMVFERGYYDY